MKLTLRSTHSKEKTSALPMRRFAVPLAMAPLVLAACGGGESAGAPILRVLGDAVAMSANSTEGLNERLTMLANVRFELAGELPDLTGSSPAYVMKPGEPARDEVDTLRSIFGIESELQAMEAAQGGGFFAGSNDGSGPSLYVGGDAVQYWNYSAPVSESIRNPACFDTSGIEPVAPPTPVSDQFEPDASATEETVPDATSSDAGVGSGDMSVDDASVADAPLEEVCPEDELPMDIPTDDEAVQMFSDLMFDLGVDADDLDIDVFSDPFGASVIGYLRVGGVRSPLSWTVNYADAGRILWAGGVLGEAKNFADYPRMGTAAGLDRLNAEQSEMLDQLGGGSAVDPASATAVDSDEANVIRIVEVEEELIMLYGVDGSVYLVPGYAFLAEPDEFGFEPRYTVTAVSDEYIEKETADVGGVETVPVVGEPGEPGVEEPGVENPDGDLSGEENMEGISAEEANTLLGMSEAEATSAAEANGWVVRVAARDGEQFALTMDYNSQRVNLTVDNGVVTYVFVG